MNIKISISQLFDIMSENLYGGAFNAAVNCYSDLSESQVKEFLNYFVNFSIYDPKIIKRKYIMYIIDKSLKSSKKCYKCYLDFIIKITDDTYDITRSGAYLRDSIFKTFINNILRNIPITEEFYIKHYDNLKPFNYVIFVTNKELKKSDNVKCIMTAYDGNKPSLQENIKRYIKTRASNKISSFKNITVDDVKEWPGIINWNSVITKNKINDNNYTRLPKEYEDIFKDYYEKSNSTTTSSNLIYSYDTTRYYYLYCFDVNNHDKFIEKEISIIFIPPKKYKKEYIDICKRLASGMFDRNSNNMQTKQYARYASKITEKDYYNLVSSDDIEDWQKSTLISDELKQDIQKGLYVTFSLTLIHNYHLKSQYINDLRNIFIKYLIDPHKER